MASFHCSPSSGCTYGVLLSFKRDDTRHKFINRVYTALDLRGTRVSVDDETLKMISADLLKVIEESRFAVVFFSKINADSPWCSDELEKIRDCQNRMGQEVLPLFYYVDPRKRKFTTAFEQHEEEEFKGDEALTAYMYVSGKTNSKQLWKLEEVHDFIKKNRKLKSIEAIVVPPKQKNVHKKLAFNGEVFESMENLRLLDVYQKFTSREPTVFPEELRWLCWNQYPFSILPLANMPKLVGLEMHHGNIDHLWEGQKIMPNLKFVTLQQLDCLTKFPDVSEAPNIERLVLTNCKDLVEVHESLGNHKRIAYVDMSNCWKLKCFPSRIEMESLETLILSECRSLEQFPEVMPCMEKLSNIHLDGCSGIKGLPLSISNVRNLSFLNLTSCKSLENISDSICELKNLKSLNLHDCMELLKLPDEFGKMEKLEELQLGFTNSYVALPMQPQFINFCTLTNLCSLRKLDLSWRRIEDKDFPINLHGLSLLEEFNISGNSKLTQLPASITRLSNLKLLELNECYGLKNLHSLPPGIQVLRASDCNLLENIEDLRNNYERLYKIWLVGCWNLPDQEAKMLQLSFLEECAAVGHRLSIAIPGSKIPRWFNAEQDGCDITLELPPGWHTKTMGFAISGVFSRMWKMRDDYPVITFTIVNSGRSVPKAKDHYIDDAFEIDTVWIGYIPFSSFQDACDDWSEMEGKLAINVSLKTGQLPVRCGAHIVYKEDEESILQPTIHVSDYCSLKCVTRKGNSFTYKDEFRKAKN